ncbi:Uncharacterised protein [Mycobacterium tuberculosis]|nr:Uncharacterised protein [Mycobacterium tuberculosis]
MAASSRTPRKSKNRSLLTALSVSAFALLPIEILGTPLRSSIAPTR